MASSNAVGIAWILWLLLVRCTNALHDKECLNLDEKVCTRRSSCLFLENECVDRHDRLLSLVKTYCFSWSSKFKCVLDPCCYLKRSICYTKSSCGKPTPSPTDSPTPSPTETPSKAPIHSTSSGMIPVSTTTGEIKEAGHLQLTSFGLDLINEGVKRARSAIEKELLVSVNEAFNSIGAPDLVADVMSNIGVVESKVQNVIRILKQEKDNLRQIVATVDDMFNKSTEALQNHLDGHCFSSDDDDDLRRRLSTNEMKKKLKDKLGGNADTVKQIGASFLALHEISSGVGNPTVAATTSITCSNGTILHDQVDNGAIAVMVTESFESQFEKNGKSISSWLNVGIDAGITIPAGDVKLAARTGLLIEAERNSGASESTRGLKRRNVGSGRNIQHLSNNTSLNATGTAGVKVYLPGFTNAMDGWGGFDVTLDIKAISSKFKGVTVHFRHPWYQCKRNNENEFNEDILDINAWSVAGFSINYFQFNNAEEFKEGIEAFEGFDKVMDDLVDMLDMNNWEKNADFSVSIGPTFIAGIDSTRCDWDMEANLDSQPYASTSSILQCSVLRRARRNLREFSHNKTYQAMNDQQLLQPFEVKDDRIWQASNANNNALRDIMDVFIDLLGEGGLEIPYCVGQCLAENTNSAKAIQGNITIIPTEGCDGIRALATAKEMTLANSAYLFLSEIDESLADAFVSEFSGIGNFGISKPRLELEVTASPPKMKIEVSGSPQLPRITSDTGDIEKFFIEAFSFLEDTDVALSAEIQGLEYFQMMLSISLDAMPIDGTSLSLESLDGKGPSVYTKYKINSLLKPKSQILTGGMVIPLKICTSNCNMVNSEEFIYVAGDVSAELTVGKKTAVTIGGTLSMIGTWDNALGIPILHISNAIIGAQFDITKSFPPPPTKLILGANICLGSQEACNAKIAANQDYIEAITYLKINANAPEENGIISLRSQLTIVPFLKVIGGLSDEVNNIMLSLIGLLPEEIKRTGIYPYDYNSADCTSNNNPVAIAAGNATLRKECYAYIAYAGQTVNIEEVGMEIPKGFSLAGKLNLANRFEMSAKVHADFLEPSNRKFSIDATIKNTEVDGILQLGGRINPDTKEVEDDAVFKVDFDILEMKIYIDIKGAIAFPFLESYATVDIKLNKDRFYFNSKLSLFDGLIEPMAHIEWDWAFSHFNFKFTDIRLGNGIVLVNEMSAGMSATGGLQNAQATWLMDILIPILFGSATLDATITTQAVSVRGSIKLLNGIIDASANVFWKWDMSEFKLDIDALMIKFGGLELGLKEMKMEWRQNELTASAKVSALFIENVEATLTVTNASGGTRISGGVTSDLGSISATVLIKNDGIKELDIEVDIDVGALLEAAWGLAKEVINEVKKAVTGVLTDLADDMKKAADEVKDLPIIGECVAGVLDIGADVLSWSANAMDNVIDGTVRVIEDVGEEIASWFEDDPDPLYHIYKGSCDGYILSLDIGTIQSLQALYTLFPFVDSSYNGKTNIIHPFGAIMNTKLHDITVKQITNAIGCRGIWELEVRIETITILAFKISSEFHTWKVTYSTHTDYETCQVKKMQFKNVYPFFQDKIALMHDKVNKLESEKSNWHELLNDDLDNIHPQNTASSGSFKANGPLTKRTISGTVKNKKSFNTEIDLDLSSAHKLRMSLAGAKEGKLKEVLKTSYLEGMPEPPSRLRRN